MNRNFTEEMNEILVTRFGKDSLIGLATVENNIPYVRTVDAYYENEAFYVITYALSNKMRQINNGSPIAISGEWFTGHGQGVNLGWFKLEQNKDIAQKLRTAFAAWIDNGHNDFDDENTIILCIKLTDAVLYGNGKRFIINF